MQPAHMDELRELMAQMAAAKHSQYADQADLQAQAQRAAAVRGGQHDQALQGMGPEGLAQLYESGRARENQIDPEMIGAILMQQKAAQEGAGGGGRPITSLPPGTMPIEDLEDPDNAMGPRSANSAQEKQRILQMLLGGG